jgi:hypothetical protein
MDVVDSQAMGAYFVADRLWERLRIAEGIAKVAASRRLDGEIVERVIFPMAANRLSVKPLSKLAGCTWVARSAHIRRPCRGLRRRLLRAMDFFLSTLLELQETAFFSVASLLNLEVDLLFFDTSFHLPPSGTTAQP